jgi:hypothetical protein
MNADDRTNPATERTFSPVNDDAVKPAAAAPTPATGDTPVTGTVPQRTALRPGAPARYSAPQSGTYSTTGQHATPAPATRAAAQAAAAQTAAQQAPVSAPAPGHSFTASASGAAAAGMGKLKGYANKAKVSLTEGDDVTAARGGAGPRKARVLLSRIDPWSALKMGFLLSIAAGIMLVVAVFVLWSALNEMGFFVMANEWIRKLFVPDQETDLLQFTNLGKVMSATVLLSIINVVLLTALTTIGAFLYNIVSSVVGGVYVTLTDD